MFEFLRGTVVFLDTEGNCALDVHGVGYRLRVSEHTRATIPLDGSTITMHVRLHVKEDEWTLFGFGDVAERAAFDLLRSVQGVGPAVALNVLSHMDVATLARALAGKDAAALKKVKGVGAKTAQRLALELHDKVERIPVHLAMGEAPGAAEADEAHMLEEVRQGLIALGFGSGRVAEVLGKLDPVGHQTEGLLREALALLR